MKKLQAFKIALLIIVLAEEIKRAVYWISKTKGERDLFKKEYHNLVLKEIFNDYDKILNKKSSHQI
ncbi:hypothetical protein [Macrococcus bovicus]|uniref:hypothetical protein n=1 Tax=Macrococcus bovicus TaxID=69968 RepID=UPI0025A5D9F4|nr:hypothetical protein [Macrococcus bovicus]WJP97097.1 hypothetical protein QSV55_07370 [Macrococcus bovicus]